MKLPRAERRRLERQLHDLAKARNGDGGLSSDEWMELWREHHGTPEACPNGHPEIALAFLAMPKDSIDEDYIWPACGEHPVGTFGVPFDGMEEDGE